MIAKSILSGKIVVCLLIFSAIIVFTPIMRSGLLLIIVGLFSAIFVFMNFGKKYYQRHSRLLLYTCLYMFICIVYKLLGISSASLGAIVVHIIFFLFIILMISLPYKITPRQNIFLIYAIIVIVLFNVIDNIRLCLTYPQIYALVNRGNEPMAMNMNIGGTRFYNAIFFFFTICFFGFLNIEKKKMKFIMLICVVLSGTFIFAFCLKAAVIVFSCLSVFLLFFAKRAKNLWNFSLRIFIPAMIFFGLVNIFSDLIIEAIMNLFKSDRLALRLAFLIDSESSTKGAGTVEARENLWMLSINTWTDNISNFLFGIGDHRADWDAGQTAEETGIGQHSDFFDSFARYGIFGVYVLFNIFYLVFKYLLSLFGKQYKIQLLVIITIFIMFGLTKGVFRPDISLVLFVFLSLLANFLNKGVKFMV